MMIMGGYALRVGVCNIEWVRGPWLSRYVGQVLREEIVKTLNDFLQQGIGEMRGVMQYQAQRYYCCFPYSQIVTVAMPECCNSKHELKSLGVSERGWYG